MKAKQSPFLMLALAIMASACTSGSGSPSEDSAPMDPMAELVLPQTGESGLLKAFGAGMACQELQTHLRQWAEARLTEQIESQRWLGQSVAPTPPVLVPVPNGAMTYAGAPMTADLPLAMASPAIALNQRLYVQRRNPGGASRVVSFDLAANGSMQPGQSAITNDAVVTRNSIATQAPLGLLDGPGLLLIALDTSFALERDPLAGHTYEPASTEAPWVCGASHCAVAPSEAPRVSVRLLDRSTLRFLRQLDLVGGYLGAFRDGPRLHVLTSSPLTLPVGVHTRMPWQRHDSMSREQWRAEMDRLIEANRQHVSETPLSSWLAPLGPDRTPDEARCASFFATDAPIAPGFTTLTTIDLDEGGFTEQTLIGQPGSVVLTRESVLIGFDRWERNARPDRHYHQFRRLPDGSLRYRSSGRAAAGALAETEAGILLVASPWGAEGGTVGAVPEMSLNTFTVNDQAQTWRAMGNLSLPRAATDTDFQITTVGEQAFLMPRAHPGAALLHSIDLAVATRPTLTATATQTTPGWQSRVVAPGQWLSASPVMSGPAGRAALTWHDWSGASSGAAPTSIDWLRFPRPDAGTSDAIATTWIHPDGELQAVGMPPPPGSRLLAGVFYGSHSNDPARPSGFGLLLGALDPASPRESHSTAVLALEDLALAAVSAGLPFTPTAVFHGHHVYAVTATAIRSATIADPQTPVETLPLP